MSLDETGGTRVDFLSEELQGADAVAPERRQKAEWVGAFCPDALSDLLADTRVIRQEIVEHCRDWRTDVTILTKRQRERYRQGVLPSEPCLVVAKIDRARRLAVQPA